MDLLTESPWTGKIASLFLFHLFLWTYQNDGGEWRVVHMPFTCHTVSVLTKWPMAKRKKKTLSFTDSLTQMPPSWGTKLPLAAFTDTGTQMFSENKLNCSQPETSEGDVCICPDHRSWGTTEQPSYPSISEASEEPERNYRWKNSTWDSSSKPLFYTIIICSEMVLSIEQDLQAVYFVAQAFALGADFVSLVNLCK